MGKRATPDGDSAPSPIDVHVGARIREQRTKLGMSQEKLGDALKLTFQQIQKYERGVNRVGASRLFDLCRVFDVPADYFFEGLPEFAGHPAFAARRPAPAGYAFAEAQTGLVDEPDLPPDAAALLDSFSRITDSEVRKRVLDLVKSLAGSG